MMTDVSEDPTASILSAIRETIVLMMVAVQTSETSVNSYQSTRRYNPEDGHVHNYALNQFCKFLWS
jgi:hypothetical protein